jgi:hypothetical protein
VKAPTDVAASRSGPSGVPVRAACRSERRAGPSGVPVRAACRSERRAGPSGVPVWSHGLVWSGLAGRSIHFVCPTARRWCGRGATRAVKGRVTRHWTPRVVLRGASISVGGARVRRLHCPQRGGRRKSSSAPAVDTSTTCRRDTSPVVVTADRGDRRQGPWWSIHPPRHGCIDHAGPGRGLQRCRGRRRRRGEPCPGRWAIVPPRRGWIDQATTPHRVHSDLPPAARPLRSPPPAARPHRSPPPPAPPLRSPPPAARPHRSPRPQRLRTDHPRPQARPLGPPAPVHPCPLRSPARATGARRTAPRCRRDRPSSEASAPQACRARAPRR